MSVFLTRTWSLWGRHWGTCCSLWVFVFPAPSAVLAHDKFLATLLPDCQQGPRNNLQHFKYRWIDGRDSRRAWNFPFHWLSYLEDLNIDDHLLMFESLPGLNLSLMPFQSRGGQRWFSPWLSVQANPAYRFPNVDLQLHSFDLCPVSTQCSFSPCIFSLAFF